MNPTWGIYILHSLHGQFSGCHFSIFVLKKLTLLNSFNVIGTKSHTLGPKLDKLSDLWSTVLMLRYKKMRNASNYNHSGKFQLQYLVTGAYKL